MKNLISLLVTFLIWTSLSAPFLLAQNSTENLLEKVDLNFSLSGKPTPEAVGFDNPKSYWKLEYELVLTDSLILEKLGRCNRAQSIQLDCPVITDKKLDKKIRKISIRIAKGKFDKKELISDSSREVVIPIQLSAEVVNIFNQAITSDSNPTFVLFIKTKSFTKDISKMKFKKKFSTSGVHPLKFYRTDKTFDFWNIKSFGAYFSIYKQEDGKITGFGIYRD